MSHPPKKGCTFYLNFSTIGETSPNVEARCRDQGGVVGVTRDPTMWTVVTKGVDQWTPGPAVPWGRSGLLELLPLSHLLQGSIAEVDSDVPLLHPAGGGVIQLKMILVQAMCDLCRELTRAAIVMKTAMTKTIPVKRIQVTLRRNYWGGGSITCNYPWRSGPPHLLAPCLQVRNQPRKTWNGVDRGAQTVNVAASRNCWTKMWLQSA